MYTTLVTVTPPAIEPVTVAVARKHCRVDNTDDDDLIAAYVSTARTLAEDYLGRALLTQTLTYILSQSPLPSVVPMTIMAPLILPMWLPAQLIFQAPIQLPRAPVQSIAAVTVSQTDGTILTLPTSGYSTDTVATPARVLLATGYQPLPNQDCAITFVAGYGSDPMLVPANIRTAILFTTAWLYEHRGDEQLEMPETANMLLAPNRLVGVG